MMAMTGPGWWAAGSRWPSYAVGGPRGLPLESWEVDFHFLGSQDAAWGLTPEQPLGPSCQGYPDLDTQSL